MANDLPSRFRQFRSLARHPYRRGGVLGLVVCISVVLVGLEGWQLWHLYDANMREAGAVTATTARSLAEQADNTIKTADTIAASLVERVEAEGTGPEAKVRFNRLMTSLAAALPAIHEMGIIDERGNAIVKSLVADPAGLNYAEREYFRFHATHTDRGPFIGERVKSKIDGSYNITVTRRINHADGSFAGVVVTSVSMKFFQQLFDQVRTRSGGIIALLSDDGTILARSPADAVTTSERIAGGELRQRMQEQRNAGSLPYTSAIDNVRRFGSYQHLGQFPLTTLVAQSEWDVQASFRSQLIWNALILLLVLIVVAVMGGRAIKANRLLKSQAMQDGLTGLGNRRLFEETIRSEFRRAARSTLPMSVILIDLDHFKAYNDTYGHLAGDECLCAIAGAIRSCIRRAGDLVARYGGEEIVVVLPGLDRHGAVALARTMKRVVRELALPHARSVNKVVTFSAGVATYVPGQSVGSWQTLIEAADAALYEAKAKGRDLIECWSPPVVPLNTSTAGVRQGLPAV